MKNIVGISIDNEKLEYYYVGNLELKQNITVIVEKDGFERLGKVETPVHPINEENLKKNLNNIIRIATKKDFSKYNINKKNALAALKKCRQLVKREQLDMNVLDAYYTLNQEQLVFTFFAESRIDFRNLAKELANIYKTRIDLHQIGVRDKSKKIGGYGLCGQELCCSRYMNEFSSVSISMAKNQNLSLNPTKINGLCGRLLCCLKYEDDTYKACRKNLPKEGEIVELDGRPAKVVSVDILKNTYKVEQENKEIVELNGKD